MKKQNKILMGIVLIVIFFIVGLGISINHKNPNTSSTNFLSSSSNIEGVISSSSLKSTEMTTSISNQSSCYLPEGCPNNQVPPVLPSNNPACGVLPSSIPSNYIDALADRWVRDCNLGKSYYNNCRGFCISSLSVANICPTRITKYGSYYLIDLIDTRDSNSIKRYGTIEYLINPNLNSFSISCGIIGIGDCSTGVC